MQEKTTYIRPKVIGTFPRPCTSGSYVHQATLFFRVTTFHMLNDTYNMLDRLTFSID
jgi:hypothetical protein